MSNRIIRKRRLNYKIKGEILTNIKMLKNISRKYDQIKNLNLYYKKRLQIHRELFIYI